jgi:hypothetical protein
MYYMYPRQGRSLCTFFYYGMTSKLALKLLLPEITEVLVPGTCTCTILVLRKVAISNFSVPATTSTGRHKCGTASQYLVGAIRQEARLKNSNSDKSVDFRRTV